MELILRSFIMVLFTLFAVTF